jgi:ribonuclease Z
MVEGVDALYHESTYISADEDKAKLYNHSTSRQAAMVARDACAGKLILGHFSARYDDERVLLYEAKEIFENSIMAAENSVIDVR